MQSFDRAFWYGSRPRDNSCRGFEICSVIEQGNWPTWLPGREKNCLRCRVWPTWFYLMLGCAETKQFCLMYHTWSTIVCLEVTILQVWRWTPWICLNWRRHHDLKFALSQLPSSCFGIPTCCSCDCIMIPIVVDELCIRAQSKCSCWISTGCWLSISC